MIRPSHVLGENNGTQTKALNPCVLRRREKEYTMCEHQSCWSLKALVITTERDASNPQSNAHRGGICPWRRDRNPLTPTETESLCNSAPSDKSYSYCIWWILSFPPIRLSCCFRSVCLCMCVRLYKAVLCGISNIKIDFNIEIYVSEYFHFFRYNISISH